MPVKVTVLYENKPGSKFDMDYYLNTHMPLVSKSWQQYGLKGWEVQEFRPSPDGQVPPYQVQATLIWDNQEDLKKGLESPETPTVLGDVPNFTDLQPILMGGPVLKTHMH